MQFQSNVRTQTIMDTSSNVNSVKFFGFDFSSFPKWFIFAFGTIGILFTFLLNSISFEKLIINYSFNESLFLTFIQQFGYASFSLPTLIRILRGKIPLHAKFHNYFITSSSLMLSMLLANFASFRLNYPTHVMFKSSKLIPVMIGNIFFLKKYPTKKRVLAVIMVIIGLIGMSLADYKGKNKFDNYGIIAEIVSLSFDAIASNMEEKIMSVYGASQDELISIIYLLGSVVLFALSVIMGEAKTAVNKISKEPFIMVYIIGFSMFGAIGIQFVYLIMKTFGSLTTVMVTSLRKGITVFISYAFFNDKHFTKWHFISLILLISGMSLNINSNSNSSNNSEKVVSTDEQSLLENEEEEDIHFLSK